jgi:hypothetical protein
MIQRVNCDRLWSFKLVFHSRLGIGTRCGTLQRGAVVSLRHGQREDVSR